MTGWHKESKSRIVSGVQHIYTIFVFVIGWVMFRAENMSYSTDYIKNMFGLVKEHTAVNDLSYYLDNVEMLALMAGVLCAMPVFNKILYVKYEHKVLRTLINVWLFILFVVSSATIAASTYNPFIYFRF